MICSLAKVAPRLPQQPQSLYSNLSVTCVRKSYTCYDIALDPKVAPDVPFKSSLRSTRRYHIYIYIIGGRILFKRKPNKKPHHIQQGATLYTIGSVIIHNRRLDCIQMEALIYTIGGSILYNKGLYYVQQEALSYTIGVARMFLAFLKKYTLTKTKPILFLCAHHLYIYVCSYLVIYLPIQVSIYPLRRKSGQPRGWPRLGEEPAILDRLPTSKQNKRSTTKAMHVSKNIWMKNSRVIIVFCFLFFDSLSVQLKSN